MSNSYLSNLGNKDTIDWISLINESVHTSDDVDIGDICAVSRNFVVVKRDLINVHYYYIPVKKLEGWDGDVLWLKVTEKEVKEKYERDRIPDPNNYYVKYYPNYTGFTGYHYPLPVIVPRYAEPEQDGTKSSPEKNVPRIYKYALYEEVFQTEEGLDKHMNIAARH